MKNIKKEFAILYVLGGDEAIANNGLGVVRTAEAIGYERSQVSRTLKTLANSGFVERDPDTLKYTLGWQFFALAARAGNQRLINTAPPVLRRLVQILDETAHISVLQGSEVLGVLQESPSHGIQAASWAGMLVPAYCTSSGRSLLLDHSRARLGELFSGVEFYKLGPNTVRDVDQLYERILAARERGYACVQGEVEPNFVAVGAPIRDFRDRIVAALNVEGPEYRLRGQRLENAKWEVKECANKLSSLLGSSSSTQNTWNGEPSLQRLRPAQSLNETNQDGVAQH
jgi:IclR family KDG regulon transcriptional repressor